MSERAALITAISHTPSTRIRAGKRLPINAPQMGRIDGHTAQTQPIKGKEP